ncbi:MAG: hypothetical protein Q4C58_04855 [Eubacteriales bacterium]|nr:hypothetical protein [Eubacteriales bacterium]
MKNAIIKLVTFIGVFIISLIVISFYMNKGNTDMTAQMSGATLPTVAVKAGSADINLMRGYCTVMETAGMRESITPVGEQRQVDIVIHTHGQEIRQAAYEVRSIDGTRLIENTVLSGFEKSGSDLKASFRLKDLIEKGEEYSLIFILTLENDREVRYYTRVIQDEYNLEEKLDFVLQFSEATFDYEKLQEYTKYLESNSDGNNSTLAKVDIHSSAKQVAWGGLEVQKETETEVQVKEIAPQTASVVLTYLVSYLQNDKKVYAQVEEYYRVRYTTDRMYLLSYERTAQQLLEESSWSFDNDKINIGIADSDIEMVENDGGTVFAFSHAGALYSYNGADSKLAVLFTFLDENGDDERTWYNAHGFRILQVDETGNVTFAVYGYMNRGRHEGSCGVQVCYYSSMLNVVEELAYIPYTKSAGILEADMENLSYVNGKNDLYLMLDGSIYHIGLENKESDVVVRGLSEECYRVSEEGRVLVWQEGGQEFSSEKLVLMDLNSGKKDEIEAGAGNYIRPLGFMGDDLIYGVASKEDVTEDSLGYIIFPMYRIVIRDYEGTILKTYEPDGAYVTECSIEDNQISLERVVKTGSGFESTAGDQILYSDQMPAGKNYADTVVTENLQTIVQIVLKSQVDSKKVKILTPREVLFEGSREVALQQQDHPARYYVYGKTGVADILTSPAAAVRLAYENYGTVAAEDGSYVLKRDRLHTSNQIMAITGELAEDGESSLAVCLNAILQFEGLMRDSNYLLKAGKDVQEILEDNLEGRKVLNLQGCSLDMVLYYPDREKPVLAVLEDGNAVLITGFNEQNVVIMDPQTGTVYKKGMNDARAWFEENGNQFIAYW